MCSDVVDLLKDRALLPDRPLVFWQFDMGSLDWATSDLVLRSARPDDPGVLNWYDK